MKSPELSPSTSFLSKRLGKDYAHTAIMRAAVTGTVTDCAGKNDETLFCERCR